MLQATVPSLLPPTSFYRLLFCSFVACLFQCFLFSLINRKIQFNQRSTRIQLQQNKINTQNKSQPHTETKMRERETQRERERERQKQKKRECVLLCTYLYICDVVLRVYIFVKCVCSQKANFYVIIDNKDSVLCILIIVMILFIQH